MSQNPKAIALVAIVVAVICIAAAVAIMGKDDPHAVKYHLDGGEFVGDHPGKYEPGVVLEVPSPIKHGYSFHGWYTDEDLTVRFDGSTEGLEGPLNLYAEWSDLISGSWVLYDISGTRDAGMNSYTMEGNTKTFFGYYSEARGAYNMMDIGAAIIHYTELGKDWLDIIADSHWKSELGGMRIIGHETIPTAAGDRDCEVMEEVVALGDTWTYWIADGWVPYKMVHTVSGLDEWSSTKTVTIFIYTDKGYDPMSKECDLEVIPGDGVKVSGNQGTYERGSIVLLTASEDSQKKGFGGWYDDGMNLLCEDPTYMFEITSDTKIYALNMLGWDSELEPGSEADLEDMMGTDADRYIITNRDTGAEATSEDGKYVFAEGGFYSVMAYDGDAAIEIYNILVDGDLKRVFEWDYGGESYSMELSLDYTDVTYARSYYEPDKRRADRPDHVIDRTFVTMSYTDPHMAPYTEQAADLLISMYTKGHGTADEYGLLDFILVFTQNIEYQEDERYTGYSEYWKFPLETLCDQGGDCEDTAILFVALAHVCAEKLGLDYKLAIQLLPQHAGGAVLLDDPEGYDTNPYGYIFAETTATDYDLGEIPGKVEEAFLEEKYYSGVSVTVEIDRTGSCPLNAAHLRLCIISWNSRSPSSMSPCWVRSMRVNRGTGGEIL